MPRALDLFAKRGVVPDRVAARRHDGDLLLDIEVSGLAPETAEHIERCLAGMVTVQRALLDVAGAHAVAAPSRA